MRKIFSTTLLILTGFVISYAQDPIFTSPGHYGQTFINYSLSDNFLYAAPERFVVTSTVQQSNAGLLFDQDYDQPAITVSAGQSVTLSIDLKAKGGLSLSNPAGFIYINCYQLNYPDSVYARIYDSTGDFVDFDWHDGDVWQNASTTSPYLLYRLKIPEWAVNRSKIELKMFAQSGTPLILNEIEYYLESPGQFEKGLVSKFTNNSLWRDMEWRDENNVKRAFIKSNGSAYVTNLGIGTTNISDTNYKLFVEGPIRARKIKVDHDNWPDYVFSEGYKLHPLTYVASYIKANQHLPGVPSATQIKEQGLDIAENQALLMQKIEELTLYLIKQDKKIEQQQKQLDQMEKLQKAKPSN